ncbi:MAG: hypothetical protein Athens071426_57 [Parcubacteria group bacterium Athens0714_26]|nr:MAG: hypothetical protein Athens101426_567 [Parcubacteria group bacterium Athens1014_26]TSD03775.1 MAG: hypothetical protein Athens071426_57 [Parcubacteria group bacterium Athens0714_26]
MNKKSLLIITVLVALILGTVAVVYTIVYKKAKLANELISAGKSQQPQNAENPQNNSSGAVGGAKENKPSDRQLSPAYVLEKDKFSISIPVGWKDEYYPSVSAMVLNQADELNDPAAMKDGFKSYFSVSHEDLRGHSREEYANEVKKQIMGISKDAIINNEKYGTINGHDSYSFESKLTRDGINFRVLLVFVKGDSDDIWTMSFNTTEVYWDSYKSIFTDTANSFKIKSNAAG